MYVYRNIRHLSFILIALSFATSVFASEALDKAKEALAGLEASLTATAAKIHTNEGRIKSYKTNITDAEIKLEEAKADLISARSELIQAQHDKSEEAARKAELAQKSYELSDIAATNREKRLNRLVRKLEELETEHKKLLADSQYLQTEIKDKTEHVSQLTTKENSKAAPAAKTVAATRKAKKKTTPPPAAVKVRKETQSPVAANNSGSQPKKTTISSNPKTNSIKAPTTTASRTNEDTPSEDNPQKHYAESQMAMLSDRIRGGGDKEEWNRYRNLNIKINREDPQEFEFLGNYQYYAEVPLEAGESELKILSKKYRANTKENGTYIIIYDTTDMDKPKFSIFNKNLIN